MTNSKHEKLKYKKKFRKENILNKNNQLAIK